MKKTKLYIDCQFFQTPVWDRGMGKYVFSLLQAATTKLGDYDIELIFSSKLPKNPDMISQVKISMPSAKSVELDLETTKKLSYHKAASINKDRLNRYVGARSDAIFFIPCLFQEPTVSVYPDSPRRIMIYYDAIPFLYYQKYKPAINFDNYLQRYTTLLQSNTILTISNTVADDLAVYLGIENERHRIISLDGSAVDGSTGQTQKPKGWRDGEYILLTTSDDIRKNNLTAIRAFEQLRKISKRDLKMVITSSFRKDKQEELKRQSDHLIFTGNIDIKELNWLYDNCLAVLCSSEYEGLGLPILEAIRFNKPIACSNIAVFREISSQAFYFFDPLIIEDITLQLKDAMDGVGWDQKKSLYSKISEKYTWDRSADILSSEFEEAKKTTPNKKPRRPKIAILCPTPSGYSSVGRTVQEIHDALAAQFDIDYYFEDRKKAPVDIRPNYLSFTNNSYRVSDFTAKKYGEYQSVIYHIGNSEYHFETILRALYLPGIAIIHDTKLVECFGEMAAKGYISAQRWQAEANLNQLLGTDHSAFLGSLLNNQIGVIFHSKYAQRAINEINRRQVIAKLSILALPAPKQSLHSIKRKTVHIGLGGVLSGKRKGIDIVKELAKDPELEKLVSFHVFGFNLLSSDDIKELKTYDNITVQTNLSDLAYQTQLANLDIMINYRSEYKGETSSSALEAMRYGCTVIVNGREGWFAELPDSAVAKVNDPDELEIVLKRLILSPATRHKIGLAAKAYVAKNHKPTTYAEDLKELFDKVIAANTINTQKSKALRQSGSLSEVINRFKQLDVY